MTSHIQNWNNKKIAIFSSIAVIIIVSTLIVNVLLNHSGTNDTSIPSNIGLKDARALPEDGQCLSNNVAAKANAQAQPALGEDGGFWTSYIYDVPAGVNVDVNIASYGGGDTVAGSLFYSDNYGKYNFTATKQTNEWRYTRFARCQ